MIHFMFSGNEKTVSSIKDLDLLFELYRLADKVMKLFSVLWIRIQNPNGVSNFVDPDQHSEYGSRSFTIKFRYRKIKRKEISEISLHPIFSKNKKDFNKDFSGLKKIFQKMNCLKFVFKLDYVRYPVTVLNTISDLSNSDQNLGKIQDPFSGTIYNLAALWIQNTGCFCYY